MPSIKLPSVVDVAITTIKELLAFTTLPYYQVPGVLKAAEGAVVVGDPIAWNTGTGEFIKYVSGETQVTDEAVFTGTAATDEFVFALDHNKIIAGSVTVKINSVTKAEGTDYSLDYATGVLTLVADLGTGLPLTATYKYKAGTNTPVIGFVRIPGDSTSAAVPIEVVVGGAVKYSVISAASLWKSYILDDIKGRYIVAADAVIF